MSVIAPVPADIVPVGPSTTDPDNFDPEADDFVAAIRPFGIQMNALGENVYLNALDARDSAIHAADAALAASGSANAASGYAGTALNKANAAADSAAAAALSAAASQGVQLIGTSTTSLVLGTGAKVLVTQSGKQWPANVPIIAVNTADATQYVYGTVGGYVGTSLTINVTAVGGVIGASVASWVISTSGIPGAPGQTASNTQFAAIPVAALNLDLSLGNYFTKTINGNSTVTFSNPPAGGFSFTLRLTHTSGVIALPASVVAPNGQIPTLLTGRVHLFMFATDDGGTTWRMAINPNYPS